MSLRLHVALARAGCGSRRACEQLMRDGVVAVNGEIVSTLGTKVDDGDRITVRGRPIRGPQALRYLLLNKPRAVVSTASDPEGRRTVLDFVPHARERLYPVGRLDYQSEGLILLTNDGELADTLLHPRHAVPRVYLARVRGQILPEEAALLAKGLRLAGKPTGAILVRAIRRRAATSEKSSWLEVTVTEGRYHLVREALLRVGHPVSRLRRVAFGPLKLGRLEPGEVRELTPAEISSLRSAGAARVAPVAGSPRTRRQAADPVRPAAPRRSRRKRPSS